MDACGDRTVYAFYIFILLVRSSRVESVCAARYPGAKKDPPGRAGYPVKVRLNWVIPDIDMGHLVSDVSRRTRRMRND